MQNTPKSNRLHIGIFGRRNAGKSSLINALTNQDISIVSDVAGTTTDPVYKAIEILPIGPCVVIDTGGLDDIGYLGELRKEKAYQVLEKTDVALIVVDTELGFAEFEEDLILEIKKRKLPFIIVINKTDKGINETTLNYIKEKSHPFVLVSSNISIKTEDSYGLTLSKKQGIDELKRKIIEIAPLDWQPSTIVGDLISEGDTVLLVIPVDSGMPKNRLILPQVQVLRDLLDNKAVALCIKNTEIEYALQSLKEKPSLVIIDSQVFKEVSSKIPEDIRLTSFSILFARFKGDLKEFVEGARAIDKLKDNSKILIAEACSHHVQKDDIARTKIPKWLSEKTGKKLEFEVSVSVDFPKNLKDFDLIIHCGGCMINRKMVLSRIEKAKEAGVPITNYGVIIAHINGILERATKMFFKTPL